MTASDIVKQLQSLGKASYKSVMLKHGVKEPLYGVPISDLKKIQKKVKMDHRLALELYQTGIYDAMYLAGLIADDQAMTKRDLTNWVAKATCSSLSEFTVPWVAAGSSHGHALALEWIDSTKEHIAAAGWSTLGSLVAVTDDDALDLPKLRQLLARVRKTIHDQPNRVRYAMNGFVISVGSYVKDLTEASVEVGEAIGEVEVDMGGTSCKVPFAPDYIAKVRQRGGLGKKRRSAKC